jgi:hypothetical protein
MRKPPVWAEAAAEIRARVPARKKRANPYIRIFIPIAGLDTRYGKELSENRGQWVVVFKVRQVRAGF